MLNIYIKYSTIHKRWKDVNLRFFFRSDGWFPGYFHDKQHPYQHEIVASDTGCLFVDWYWSHMQV